jgi:hypothetical protein
LPSAVAERLPTSAPLLDLEPNRCQFTQLAPPQPGDFETE